MKKNDLIIGKLSIIIPVHNSERYLEMCIQSVLSQTYKNIEIILVENNSTDNSYKICEKYSEQDSRIRIVVEKKSGAAAARNSGMRIATGKYITFVDSDDYLRADAYIILLQLIEEKNADIVCYSYKNISEDGANLNWYEPKLKKFRKVYTGREAACIFLNSRNIEGFCWNKLFKRSVLLENNFCFDEDKIAFEDMAVLFDLISNCGTVIFCNEKLYFYRQVKTSLTHEKYTLKHLEYEKALNQIINRARQLGLPKEAEVFKLSRNVWNDYDSLNGEEAIAEFKEGTAHTLYILLFYLKSEKIKTILKLVYLWIVKWNG